MSKFKGTPGPWQVGEHHAKMIDIRHASGDVPGAISLTLAKVVARPSWQAEAEANARLITAAPELLESLCLLVDAHDEWRGEDRPDPKAAIRQARAAIAKATGGDA